MEQKTILTQEEMETLASGMSYEVGREQPYDPRRGIVAADRPKQEFHVLKRIHAEVATATAATLSARLRTKILLEPQADDSVRFAHLQEVLARDGSTCINILDLAPLGDGLLTLDLPTSFRFIDRCLGGTGKTTVPRRTFFTEIESTTMDELIGLILSGFQRGWSKVLPDLAPKLKQRELDPKFLNLWPATENIIASSFNIVSDIVVGEMKICLPYTQVAERLIQSASRLPAVGEENLAAAPALEKRLQKVPLTLRAVLGVAEIPIQSLVQLKVGKVIKLKNFVNQPITVQVEGEPKFAARLGKVGKKFGLKIVGPLTDTEE